MQILGSVNKAISYFVNDRDKLECITKIKLKFDIPLVETSEPKTPVKLVTHLNPCQPLFPHRHTPWNTVRLFYVSVPETVFHIPTEPAVSEK